MCKRGVFQPDSVAGFVLAEIDAAGARPVTRAALGRALQPRRRKGLQTAIERLLNARLVIAVEGGLLLAGRMPEPIKMDFGAPPELKPVSEPLRLHLAAITRRAWALTAQGQKASAVLLLNTASRHPALPAHVAAGIGALAALFRHHESGATA